MITVLLWPPANKSPSTISLIKLLIRNCFYYDKCNINVRDCEDENLVIIFSHVSLEHNKNFVII